MTRTVVHFIDSHEFGGAERVALHIMAALDRSHWRPVLLHHDEPGLEGLIALADERQIPHRIVPRISTVSDLVHMPRYWRILHAEAPSVFHAHVVWPLSCKYGMLAATLARVPAVVVTAHTRFPLRDRFQGQPRLISRLVDRYMAVSDSVGDQLRNDFGIAASKIEIVRNGIDVEPYSVSRAPDLRATLTRGRKGPLVITVARLNDGKGHRDLLHAAVLVPEASFVFVGDGPLRQPLESDARALGVADRVVFLGQRDDVPALLACADLFVLPSLSEGLPLSVLEAMAAGVPVVTTAFVGVEELVQDGRTGVLAERGNPASLAQAMTRVLGNTDLARTLTAAARRSLDEGHFTVERMAAAVAQIYDSVLAA